MALWNIENEWRDNSAEASSSPVTPVKQNSVHSFRTELESLLEMAVTVDQANNIAELISQAIAK